MIASLRTLAAGLSISLLMMSGTAQALTYTYNFEQITSNGGADVGGQLKVEVTDSADGTAALFKFFNIGSIQTSITDIYFRDNTPLFLTPLTISGETSGVNFEEGANPGNLPSGFNATSGLTADSEGGQGGGVAGNGVNNYVSGPGPEWVELSLKYATSMTTMMTYALADVVAAIANNSLLVGLHVQGYANGASESYIIDETTVRNDAPPPPPEVPIPLPGVLLLSGLLGLGVLGRMRKSV